MAQPKKEFTATQVMMLQEELGKGIKVIGEQYSSLNTKVDKISSKLDRVAEDVAIIKASLPIKANKSEFEQLDKRVTVLEAKVL